MSVFDSVKNNSKILIKKYHDDIDFECFKQINRILKDVFNEFDSVNDLNAGFCLLELMKSEFKTIKLPLVIPESLAYTEGLLTSIITKNLKVTKEIEEFISFLYKLIFINVSSEIDDLIVSINIEIINNYLEKLLFPSNYFNESNFKYILRKFSN